MLSTFWKSYPSHMRNCQMMHPFDCVYIDHHQREHVFSTYAEDSFKAQTSYDECVGRHGLRLVRIVKQDQDFNW